MYRSFITEPTAKYTQMHFETLTIHLGSQRRLLEREDEGRGDALTSSIPCTISEFAECFAPTTLLQQPSSAAAIVVDMSIITNQYMFS